MSANKPPAGFPDVEAKLHTASKQSAFEKQKQEAEAKRKREAAETAAVYESFVKSFDNDDDDDDPLSQFTKPRGAQHGAPFGRGGGIHGGGPSRRHFGSSIGTALGAMKSGPGSLGPTPIPKSGPGSLGPVPNALNQRREHDQSSRGGFTPVRDRESSDGRGRDGLRATGRAALDKTENSATPTKHVNRAFDISDDEAESATGRDLAEEKAIAKPTLRLASLPPGTSLAFIKALLPGDLEVENVKILPPASPAGTTERRSVAAIVTVSKETPALDLDAAVSALQNRYLGYGFYLTIHRHLSSAVSTTAAASNLASSSTSLHPFGAKPVPQIGDKNARTFPYGGRRGYAPPTSYGPGGPVSRTILHVPVQAPQNVKQVALIHKVVESVLEHGPEFEALLMSRPEVQKGEQWAWIWDARSEGGVWYRWRLWEIVTGLYSRKTTPSSFVPIFEDSHAWKIPEKPLAYEYTTLIEEFVSDPEYNSSEDDESDNEGTKPGEKAEEQITWLNPLDKAKLTHLLTRLPMSLTRIRKGDIARITAFAITHSSRGADEVADLIVSNIVRPLALTVRVTGETKAKDHYPDTENLIQAGEETAKTSETHDQSGASLVALYVVSDILSSSATSGVRHAWRYRQLFEQALKCRNVFEILGLMAETQNWGRLRADKWKRSIGLVLDLWEGWSAFPVESQRFFSETFENPPSAKKEAQSETQVKKANRWKTVEAGASVVAAGGGFKPLPTSGAIYDGTGVMDEDNAPYDDEDDMYGSEMDTDIDGVPMDEDEDVSDNNAEPMDEDKPFPEASVAKPEKKVVPTGPRKRMTAADMFADSELSD